MNRLGTALLAAIEAVVTVGVGIGVALVPLTLLWGFEYGLQVDWDVFWKATGSVWLVGHGVDVSFLLGPALAKSSGVSGAADPIHVTLAALGFAIVTAWLGGRAGRRFAETEHRVTGLLVGTGVVAALGLAVALSTRSAAIDPVTWQAVVLPALWFGVPALVVSEVCRVRRGLPPDPLTQRLVDQWQRVPGVWRTVVAFGLRAGTAATAVVVAVAGVVVALLLFASFAEVISLYERSHAGIVGGIALTVGQLAFLPDLVGWAAAWLVGPGFAIGTGSNVSPIATSLGPIPGLPVFGALPASGHTFGLVWVLVPVLAGFAAGGLLRPRLVRALGAADSALHRALGGLATGVVAGVLTGLVAGLSAGSFGPGRLADVGPHAIVVGAVAALEVGVPAIVALAVGSDLVRLPDRGWTGDRWHDAEDETVAADSDEGSLVAALDRAGAGRTTDVHRFVVEEAHDAATTATDTATEPSGRDEPDRASRPTTPSPRASAAHDGPAADRERDRDTDADVALPDWARTDAVAADRLPAVEPSDGTASRGTAAGGVAGIRARLRGAADGVRDRADGLRERAGGLRERAGELRDRVGGGDAGRADRDAPDATPEPTAPGTDAQPAFQWSTEEFVAGRDDADAEQHDGQRAEQRADGSVAPGKPTWDATDQIPEDELPWWRRPKGER